VAEEAYCKGSAVLDHTKLLSEEAYVLDMQGPVGTAAYMAPSILSFTAAIRGRASHAGFAPEKGISAIAAAADAISMMPSGRIDEETTLNVGMISGGLATNIVPERCVVRGEVRSLCHEKAVRQAELVRRQFERAASEARAALNFEVTTASAAYETPADHPLVRRFEGACDQLRLPVPLSKPSAAATTTSWRRTA
jgi:tripeptide aminopeptidase